MKAFKILSLILALALVLSACAPGLIPEDMGSPSGTNPSSSVSQDTAAPTQTAPPSTGGQEDLPEYGASYYDVENVTLYLELYKELPPNYITKNEARELGWEGGSVEAYLEGAAIGGDRFGNYEGLLPEANGRTYTECDIDTLGYPSRGSRRLVFSNDGLYFYTSDHYETFTQVQILDGYRVQWAGSGK